MNMNNEHVQIRGTAQSLAGNAVLLEIGARLGILEGLLSQKNVSVAGAAEQTGVTESVIAAYFSALAQAGLVRPDPQVSGKVTHYAIAPGMHQSINEAGYLLWSLTSCGPLIEHAESFFHDQDVSARKYFRDGDHVARTSRWMGERDFYPQAENAILSGKPRKIVDLGSGTCGLLLRCLRKLPEAHGVGIDINRDACARARSIIEAAGMTDRLTVVEAPIQSLIEDPAPIVGADVIHAGWVFHDLLPGEERTLDALLRTFSRNAGAGALVMVEGVPYAQNPGEREFSAAYTFLHTHFMGRRLLTENEWKSKLSANGFNSVEISPLGISGGRIFKATSA